MKNNWFKRVTIQAAFIGVLGMIVASFLLIIFQKPPQIYLFEKDYPLKDASQLKEDIITSNEIEELLFEIMEANIKLFQSIPHDEYN